MEKYIIKEVKYNINQERTACGPVSGHPVISFRYTDGNSDKWITLEDVNDRPILYCGEKDIHDTIVKESMDDELVAYMQAHRINEINGIAIGSNYTELCECLSGTTDCPMASLVKSMLLIFDRCRYIGRFTSVHTVI